VASVRQGRKIPEILTPEERDALLRQPNRRYPTGERNLAMLRVMLNAGLRLSEATALRWRDIDLNTGKLMVRQGKGAKDRTLWICDEDVELLSEWRERQASTIGHAPEHVFTTLKGNPVSGRYVQQMVKRYVNRAGIAKRVSPHSLRHTFGTDIYSETGNIRLTQKALGHASLQTTQLYTHIVDEALEAAMKSFREAAAIA